METTASVDMKNYNVGEASGVEKHNKREYENDKNTFINNGNTDLNREIIYDKNKVLHDRVADEIDAKNKNTIAQYTKKKYSRKQFESNYIVDDYDYMSRQKAGIASMVIQIGGTEEYKKLLDNENIPYTFDEKNGFTYPDKDKLEPVIDLYNKTYQALNDELLKSDAFIGYEFDLHMDEGYPHVHAQYLNNGTTAKGAKSFSSNQSVAKFLDYENLLVNDKDSRINFKRFREYTDNFLVDEFNKNLANSNFKTKAVTLVRKSNVDVKASSEQRKNAMTVSKNKLDNLSVEEKNLQSDVDVLKDERTVLHSDVDSLIQEKATIEADKATAEANKAIIEAENTEALRKLQERSDELLEADKTIAKAESINRIAEVNKAIMVDLGINEKIAEVLVTKGYVTKRDGSRVDGIGMIKNSVIKLSKQARTDPEKDVQQKAFERKQMSDLNKRTKKMASDDLER